MRLPAALVAGAILALLWSPLTKIAAPPTLVGPFFVSPAYVMGSAAYAAAGAAFARWCPALGVLTVFAALHTIVRPHDFAPGRAFAVALGVGFFLLLRRAASIQALRVLWMGLWGTLAFDVLRLSVDMTAFGNAAYAGLAYALVLAICPTAVVPIFVVGLTMSKSYLAIVVAVVTLSIRWPQRFGAFVLALSVPVGVVYALRTWNVGGTIAFRVEALAAVLDRVTWLGYGLGSWLTTAGARVTCSFCDFMNTVHNEFAQWTYETGLIGLFVVLGVLMQYRKHWRIWTPTVVATFGIHVFHWPTLAMTAIAVMALQFRTEAWDAQ